MSKAKRLKVRLSDLSVDEAVFQPRDFRADGAKAVQSQGRSTAHIKVLTDALRQQGKLDPLVVWQGPQDRLWIIDGHHRYKAYLKVYGTNSNHKVEAVHFEGTRTDAIRYAFRVNSKDKLSMTRAQKSQAAWRLIANDDPVLRGLSPRKAAELLPVSHEVVRKMRLARDRLLEEGALNEFTLWRDVCSLNWDSETNRDYDAYREEKVTMLELELSAALKKYRGGDLSIITEAVQRALEETLGLESAVYLRTEDIEGFGECEDEDEDEELDF